MGRYIMKDCDNKSVDVLVWRDGKLLLIERMKFPPGFAPPAGHIDEFSSFEEASKKELMEEAGLTTTTLRLVAEERKNNMCRRDGGS